MPEWKDVVDFLNGFHIQTLVGMAIICWYYTRDLKTSIDRVDKDLIKMNTRVSRMEGTVYGKQIYDKVQE